MCDLNRVQLGDLLDYEQPTRYIVSSTDYDDTYDTPVLTAGQTFILGYTNETKGIYKASKSNPVIIFDDFVTSFYLVDFDFKVKSSALKILKPKKGVNIYYVYYAMLGINFVPKEHARHWISKYSLFEISYPSLAKQQEIVSHLDTFTTLISNLESELDMRRKQYEHYRNQLLDFEGVEGVEWKTLGDIAPYRKARIEYSLLNTHNYVSVENLLQMKKGKTDAEKVPSEGNAIKYEIGDILVGNIRPYLKKIWMAEYVGGTNGDVLVFGIKDKNILISKYLFYLLSSDTFFEYDNQHAKGGKMPRGDKSMIEKYLVPIPSPKTQREIVEKLDAFENLIESLEQEIKLRKQQYEYYREKLLTFEKE